MKSRNGSHIEYLKPSYNIIVLFIL